MQDTLIKKKTKVWLLPWFGFFSPRPGDQAVLWRHRNNGLGRSRTGFMIQS